MYLELKRLNKEKKFKRTELAELLNVCDSDISKRINGDTILKDDEKEKIFHYLTEKNVYNGSFNDLFINDNKKNKLNKLTIKENDTSFQIALKKCLEKEKKENKRSKKEICECLDIDIKTLDGYIKGVVPRDMYNTINKMSKLFNVAPNFFYDNFSFSTLKLNSISIDKSNDFDFYENIYRISKNYIKSIIRTRYDCDLSDYEINNYLNNEKNYRNIIASYHNLLIITIQKDLNLFVKESYAKEKIEFNDHYFNYMKNEIKNLEILEQLKNEIEIEKLKYESYIDEDKK